MPWQAHCWRTKKRFRAGIHWLAALLLPCLLTACAIDGAEPTATATRLPTRTQPPATATDPLPATATPSATPSATASPSETPSPSATASPTSTASPTATRYAFVRSRQRVNLRDGAGTGFPILTSLAPDTGLQVIAENEAGDWIQVRLEDGQEGWVSASLLQLIVADAPSSETPSAPSLAPEVVTNMPLFDLESVRLTATRLLALTRAADLATPQAAAVDMPMTPTPPDALAPTRLPAAPRAGVDVFAFCDHAAYGIAAPDNLSAGSTIEIFWAWFASSDAYLRQHIANATHELRINGARIGNVDAFRSAPRQERGQHVVYWYVPYGPLAAGNYHITYRVTWRQSISDGYAAYGPGTSNEFEEESCSFVVR